MCKSSSLVVRSRGGSLIRHSLIGRVGVTSLVTVGWRMWFSGDSHLETPVGFLCQRDSLTRYGAFGDHQSCFFRGNPACFCRTGNRTIRQCLWVSLVEVSQGKSLHQKLLHSDTYWSVSWSLQQNRGRAIVSDLLPRTLDRLVDAYGFELSHTLSRNLWTQISKSLERKYSCKRGVRCWSLDFNLNLFSSSFLTK